MFFRKKKTDPVAAPRISFGSRLRSIFSGGKLDDEQIEEFERLMLMNDAGVEATVSIINELKLSQVSGEEPMQLLRRLLISRLESLHNPMVIDHQYQPYVILVIGVNGSGKTTTIAKLCHYLQAQGERVMIAAGDTFRAAAVEQLEAWGASNEVTVISQKKNGDSASVIYDGVQAARARGASVLIADTAGRMHTRGVLIEELKKVVRVVGKLDSRAPHEILLVVDGTSGQNVRRQLEEFKSEFRLSGMVITKLDGSSKGGIALALDKYKVPIRFLGVGERKSDLQSFDPAIYAEQILGLDIDIPPTPDDQPT